MSKVADYYRGSVVLKFLSVVVLYLVVVTSLAFLLGSVTGWLFRYTFDVAYLSVNGVLLLGCLIWLIISRLSSGPVVLDTEPYPQRSWYIAAILIYLFISWPDSSSGQSILWWLGSLANLSLIIVLFAASARGRLQVRQRGIWLYTDLLVWNEIRSYYWKKETLYFETTGSWLSTFWAPKCCVVPEKYVEAFEGYLLEHGVPERTAESVAPA